MKFNTVGFIGLGLIGGSIAKTIRRIHPEIRILAWNRNQEVLEQAFKEGVINKKCSDVGNEFSSCDIIFLCTPVVTMLEYFDKLKPVMKQGAILTDVGSVKTEIHEAVQQKGMDSMFIGGHPMAGSEKTGYANSTDRMIENAYYVLTPGGEVSLQTIASFTEFIGSLGALPIVMSYEEHDYVTAAISHVPHVISASLVNMVHDLDSAEMHMKTIAAGGFKDITRISSSSPQMWQEICLANRDDILKVLDKYIRKLTDFAFAIRNKNGEKLLSYFTDCKDYRDSFSSAPSGPIKKDFLLYADLMDEAGAIAEIATILSLQNISIKNIGIVHNRSFEQGVLKIAFYDQESHDKAAEVLTAKHYTIYEG